MKAAFPVIDPVPELMDELIDALYLIEQCRQRGVSDLHLLLDYIEHTMDEIERHRLSTPSASIAPFLTADEVDEVFA
jgi:hypothetical protein